MSSGGYVGSASARSRGRSVGRGRSVARATTHGALTTFTVLGGLLIGLGWLYELRSLRILGGGPRVADALPLLQLAQHTQPLWRVLVAWCLVGLAMGLLLRRHTRITRVAIVGALATVLLWFDSQASAALTHNLRFSHVLAVRSVGPGPWVEAGMLALSCALAPGRSRDTGAPPS